MPIDPLDDVRIDPVIASLPKADLHLHQEEVARLGRVIARREGRRPYDYRPGVRRLLVQTPPGIGRINGVYAGDDDLALDGIPADAPEYIIAKIGDALAEGAADGAILIEVRFGVTGLALQRPDFMALFREAERQVNTQYPKLRAEAIAFISINSEPSILRDRERSLEMCLQMAREGLSGVDFRVDPYDTEADPALWATACRWAEWAADAGLGITVHAGEFSPANLAAALRVPGLRRLGHATHVTCDPHLMEFMASSGVTAECCLTCNVVLGAVASYEQHPIRQLVAHGIPVTLNTDLPVHICATIGREYAIAHGLGFSTRELVAFTRNAIQASFTSEARKTEFYAEVDQVEATPMNFNERNR